MTEYCFLTAAPLAGEAVIAALSSEATVVVATPFLPLTMTLKSDEGLFAIAVASVFVMKAFDEAAEPDADAVDAPQRARPSAAASMCRNAVFICVFASPCRRYELLAERCHRAA